MSDKDKKNGGPRKLSRKEMEETKGGFAGTVQTVKLNVGATALQAAKPTGAAFDPNRAGIADTTW